MYIPKKFRGTNLEDVEKYIHNNSFATLVATGDQRLIASHIPMILHQKDDKKFLLGHISKANELKRALDNQTELLAIFMEKHAYISSSWYDHINVPTWNYISIHVYGRARVIEKDELYNSIHKMVEKYESGRQDRFSLSDMPKKMRDAHFNGLIGFEMSVDHLEAAYKLSQNRNEKNYTEIIRRLEKEGDPLSLDIASEMKKLLP